MKYLKTLELTKQCPAPDEILELLHGSVDMHVHFGPDKKPRRDAIVTAMAAQEAGMRGLVLKSFCHPTAVVAAVTKHMAPDVDCIGSVVLDNCVTAGISEYAPAIVEGQAKVGAKVLWAPVNDAAYARSFMPGVGGGISLIDEEGKLRPEMEPILEIVKKYNMVLCSGHTSYVEAAALFTRAKEMGITKLVATHAFSDVIWDPMTMEQAKHLVSLGACVEFCYLSCTPMNGREDPENILNRIRELGAEHCIMSTDMAQITDPPSAEGMRIFIGHMLQYGATKEEIEWMVKKNPKRLLDLED